MMEEISKRAARLTLDSSTASQLDQSNSPAATLLSWKTDVEQVAAMGEQIQQMKTKMEHMQSEINQLRSENAQLKLQPTRGRVASTIPPQAKARGRADILPARQPRGGNAPAPQGFLFL